MCLKLITNPGKLGYFIPQMLSGNAALSIIQDGYLVDYENKLISYCNTKMI